MEKAELKRVMIGAGVTALLVLAAFAVVKPAARRGAKRERALPYLSSSNLHIQLI